MLGTFVLNMADSRYIQIYDDKKTTGPLALTNPKPHQQIIMHQDIQIFRNVTAELLTVCRV